MKASENARDSCTISVEREHKSTSERERTMDKRKQVEGIMGFRLTLILLVHRTHSKIFVV